MSVRHAIFRTLMYSVIIAAMALGGLAAPAAADPLEKTGGAIDLPLAGLTIELPAAPAGCRYKVSGSWALGDDNTYDGRDVIDEACGDSLTAGTWITAGYFTAGSDSAVVAAVPLTGDWASTAYLWGANWRLRGGIYDLSDLGPTPVIVLSTSLGRGMSLVMYHFYVHEAQTMPQAAMLDGVAHSAVLQAAWSACETRRVVPASPTRRDEIRNRGSAAPARPERLDHMGLDFQVPDDGAVWLVRHDSTATSDFIDRMAPTFPDVSIETVYFAGVDGPTAIAAIEVEKRDVPPRNLPDGWQPGPQLVLDGKLELTTSYETAGGVIVVGIFQDAQDTDVAYLAPMLAAIAQAANDADAVTQAQAATTDE